MQVEYKNKSLEKVCTDASAAIKKYNTRMAEKIQQRITEIKASDSVEQMLQYHIGRCHLLLAIMRDFTQINPSLLEIGA